MKICWDNLERANLSKEGNFRIGTLPYIEIDACKTCGDPYLTTKNKPSNFCGHSCAISGKNHPMYGKEHTVEARERMAIAHTGKTISTETRKKMSIASTGMLHSIETRKKMSKNSPRHTGSLVSNWKGGIKALGLASYETHKDTLGFCEDIRKQNGTEVLEVKCAYCAQWFAPNRSSVGNRVTAINNLNKGEHRFYCSENCKQSCPTYNRTKYPKDFKKGTSREVSTYLRQMVFERDNWECQKCGKTIEEAALHCHHIRGYAQNKILANDADNCITFCKECHKEVHKRYGCRYYDLRCKKEN